MAGYERDLVELRTAAGAARGAAGSSDGERYHAALDTLRDAVAILEAVRDEAGRIVDFVWTYVNDAACELNRMSREQMLGARMLEAFPELRASELFAAYCQLVESGEPLAREELLFGHVIGGERLSRGYELRASKVGDGFAVSFRDVADHKRIEVELREAARFFELSRDLVCTASFDGYFKRLNPMWGRALGWSEPELRSRPWLQFVHPDDRRRTGRVVAGLAAGGQLERFANRYEVKGGGWRWLEWTAIGVPDEGLIYATARDVSERVEVEQTVADSRAELERHARELERANAELREATDRFESLFEAAAVGMAIVSREGRFLAVNPALCRIVGYPPEELLSTTLQDITHPDDREADLRHMREMLAGERRSYQLEKRCIRADGEVVWVLLSAAAVYEATGAVSYFVPQIQDISERKRADTERLGALVQAGCQLLAELDTEAVLERVVEAARAITGARYAALSTLDLERRALDHFVTAGMDEQTKSRIGAPPRGRGVLGELIHNPAPLRLRDVTQHPRAYGFPPGHPPMRSFLGVPIVIRGEAFGNLYLTEKQGAEFDERDEDSARTLAIFAGVAIENARLYGGLEARRDELSSALQEVRIAHQVSRAIGGETDFRRVLDLIARRAIALVAARWVVVMLGQRDRLQVAAAAGEGAQEYLGFSLSADGTVLDDVLEQTVPVRCSEPDRGCALFERLGASTALMAPLTFRGRRLGVLAAFDPRAGKPGFDERDERLMVAFAASAATAVATAQAFEEERLRERIDAAESERAHWARELHDDTLQRIGAVRFGLAYGLRGNAQALERVARQSIGEVDAAIGELRRLIAELRPAPLDELGLADALADLAQKASHSGGVAIREGVELADDRGEPIDVHPEVERIVYRIVQEALTNVEKHADARSATLDVRLDGGTIGLVVADDGKGFEPSQVIGGFGLKGMLERVRLVGGELQVQSAPGRGTRLSASVPVAPGQPSVPL